jgi:tRNA (cytidine/uridine-2'-O-)-methyltransferase
MTRTGLRLALFQPDIPQNAGTMLRMAACLGMGVDIIEPAGFPVSDRHFRRSGMDYLDHVDVQYHVSWTVFNATRSSQHRRLILLTTKATMPYCSFQFITGDTIMVGRESAGVPHDVHDAADARIIIPMHEAMRSLNVAVSAAIVCGEALRQLDGFSHPAVP